MWGRCKHHPTISQERPISKALRLANRRPRNTQHATATPQPPPRNRHPATATPQSPPRNGHPASRPRNPDTPEASAPPPPSLTLNPPPPTHPPPAPHPTLSPTIAHYLQVIMGPFLELAEEHFDALEPMRRVSQKEGGGGTSHTIIFPVHTAPNLFPFVTAAAFSHFVTAA